MALSEREAAGAINMNLADVAPGTAPVRSRTISDSSASAGNLSIWRCPEPSGSDVFCKTCLCASNRANALLLREALNGCDLRDRGDLVWGRIEEETVASMLPSLAHKVQSIRVLEASSGRGLMAKLLSLSVRRAWRV